MSLTKICNRVCVNGDAENLYMDKLGDFFVARNSEVNSISKAEAFEFCTSLWGVKGCRDYFKGLLPEEKQ